VRTHSYDDGEAAFLPGKAARPGAPSAQTVRAAAEGRWDAVGRNDVPGLQRLVGNQGVAAALQDEERSPVLDVVGSGGGQPLDAGVRTDMEARFGHDFGDVRVHHDARAQESARAVNAHAYTVGANIVFQRDRYNPSSSEGRLTLAHELTHVIQQRSGPVEGTPAPGGINISDPSDRFEREAAATAEQVMTASPAPSATAGTGSQPGALGVQRQEEELDEEGAATAQGAFAQREEAEEEEPAE
jgi:hypothetical protein